MYQRILLAYAENGDRALHEGTLLAKEKNAKLRIVHVVDTIHPLMSAEYLDLASFKASQQKQGKRLLTKAKRFATQAGLHAEIKLLELTTMTQTIAGKINEDAEKWQADLIVLGTKGNKGLKRLLAGSVAAGVIRAASGNASLLLVKEI